MDDKSLTKEDEKIYTQKDMDNITLKVKESAMAKIEKNYVPIDTFKELQTKYQDLELNYKKLNFKDTFIANGGEPSAFNDFVNSNMEILDLEENKQVEKFKELKESKPFYFNKTTLPQQAQAPNDKEQMKDMFDLNSDLIEGTMYKKNFF